MTGDPPVPRNDRVNAPRPMQQGVRSLGRRSFGALIDEWRTGHLSISGLTTHERAVALLAVGVILAGCTGIVLVSAGIGLPGPVVEVPGNFLAEPAPVRIPAIAMLLVLAGLAIAGTTIALGAAEPEGKSARRLLLVLALTLAGMGSSILNAMGAVTLSVTIIRGADPLAADAFRLAGISALVGAVVLPPATYLRVPYRRAILVAAAAIPFLVLIVSTLLGGASQAITPWVHAQFLDYPSTLSVNSAMFAPLVLVLRLAAALVALLLVWQASTWSRASARQVAARVGPYARRAWWVLGTLIGLKLVWLALGIAGVLPPFLGGGAPAWSRIRSDDLASWAYAAFLVGAAGLWLLRGGPRLQERRLGPAAAVTAVAFGAIAIALAVLPLLSTLVAALGAPMPTAVPSDVPLGACLAATAGAGVLTCLQYGLVAWQGVWWTMVLGAALIFGAVLLRRRAGDAGAIFLVVLGAWTLPRALDVIRQFHPAELPGLAALPPLNAPQPETLDAVVTLLVIVLAVAWWRGLQRSVDVRALVIVLVVSTLVIHAGTLAPAPSIALLLAVPIAFPALYELAFDAEQVNRGRARAARVFAWLGLRAFALALLAATVVIDLGELSESLAAELAGLFFAVPIGATFAAVAIRAGRPIADRRAARHPAWWAISRPLVAIVLAGVAMGGMALLGHQGGGTLAAAYPTDGNRLLELGRRTVETNEELGAILRDPDLTTVPGRIDVVFLRESGWLAAHPAPPCAVDAWTVWRTVLADIRKFGILFEASLAPPDTATQRELDLVNSTFQTVGAALQADAGRLPQVMAQADVACTNARP